MQILIVGNGGREHALLWKLACDAPAARFWITGGNGGTERLATAIPIRADDTAGLSAWAAAEGIDLVVVGPEAPLAAGLVDELGRLGVPAFGPTQAAAAIESSKAFAKALMARHGIPTAAYGVFRDPGAALAYLELTGAPAVVKASGLAAGKGVVVCSTSEEARAAVHDLLGAGRRAGAEIVIEEFMAGEELSVLALSDGVNVVPLLPAQDHKRVGEGDRGPNTGGMGSYAPVSLATPELLDRVQREVLTPAVAALAAEGRPFRGLLYAGLMLTPDGPRVVEFNCRFGDPETQAILPLLRDSLLEPLHAVAHGGSLAGLQPSWAPGAAACTVLAAPGYPGTYPSGVPIQIPAELNADPEVLLFHAGTRHEGEQLVSSGGRVLATVGLGETLAQAAERSRRAAEQIDFAGKQFRRDIGWRELGRLAASGASPAREAHPGAPEHRNQNETDA